MNAKRYLRNVARLVTAGAGVAAATYGVYVGITWYRYGNPTLPTAEERDALLDQFMPVYEVVERHHVRVGAPAPVTLAAARDMDLQGSPLVRIIIRAREAILGATPDNRVRRPSGLLAEMQSLGWGVLADDAEHQVVVGAVTRPWEANVTFRALPADQFARFDEPGYIKIVWTLRADAISPTESLFRTETRAIATDATARGRFRRYWAFLSPGIILIRQTILGPLKTEAERRADQEMADADYAAVVQQPALEMKPP